MPFKGELIEEIRQEFETKYSTPPDHYLEYLPEEIRYARMRDGVEVKSVMADQYTLMLKMYLDGTLSERTKWAQKELDASENRWAENG